MCSYLCKMTKFYLIISNQNLRICLKLNIFNNIFSSKKKTASLCLASLVVYRRNTACICCWVLCCSPCWVSTTVSQYISHPPGPQHQTCSGRQDKQMATQRHYIFIYSASAAVATDSSHMTPLCGVDSVQVQVLLMGTCRQCGSWSVAGHNHRKVIRRDPICAS